jgi:DDE superfamily endonuclease
LNLRDDSDSIGKKFLRKFRNARLPATYIHDNLMHYRDAFIVHRRDNSQTAENYLGGLFICEKGHANMERMEEEINDGEYRAYQHFISNSKWDYQEIISRLSLDASNVLKENKKKSGVPTGYIVDKRIRRKG